MLQFLDFDFCILKMVRLNLWKSNNPVSTGGVSINDLRNFVKTESIGDGLSGFSKHVRAFAKFWKWYIKVLIAGSDNSELKSQLENHDF